MTDQLSVHEMLPRRPIDRMINPLQKFLHVEAASGIVLLLCAIAALVAANSAAAQPYLDFWKTPVGITVGTFELQHSLKHWINDGLMAIFFFVIGLEVKRELVLGELRELRRAALPLAAALGGMLVPAGIYLALQYGQPGADGWGVPMATDIAFVVGCMAVLGRRVPASLRVVLLSLAIVDDIGAILVIAVGYTDTIHWGWLSLGLAGIGIVLLMQRIGIRRMSVYVLAGITIWLGFHESGVHATIAGVVLGLLTPSYPYLGNNFISDLLRRASDFLEGTSWQLADDRAGKVRRFRRVAKESISPLEYLINALHPWVAYVIMPLFALANAGIPFTFKDLLSPVAVAVMLGLVVGKPAGILLFSWLSQKLKLARLPQDVQWKHLIAGGFLAGIGFTMALFISGLAFSDQLLLKPAKVGVLAGSVISAVVGMTILALSPPAPPAPPAPKQPATDATITAATINDAVITDAGVETEAS